ncbi:MAG: hypothetical protein ACI8ZM_003830 [Crocinitomix sp.]|jgi:hypothetical protein
MDSILEETNDSRLYAATHLMDLAGIPYDVINSLESAFDYPVIITATTIREEAFSLPQVELISDWVTNGGVLITSGIRDENFNDLCGINAINSTNLVHEITWDTATYPEYFDQLDDELEVTISIGRAPDPTFTTRYYTLDSGVSLGEYGDGTCALARNEYGLGHVYTFGPDLRDVIYRPQINRDIQAQRSFTNGFEPSLDVFGFIVRNIIRLHIASTIYKYPAIQNSSSTLLITHDVDSQTAFDSAFYFSDYELSKEFVASYNITTKYFENELSSAFYNPASIATINHLLINGHQIASHSVGHFPDFSDGDLFPYGETGNTMESYSPTHIGGVSMDGTVLGELEVSKNLLTADFGTEIKSWRSGHLAFPDSLIQGLELLGYTYNSTYSSNDVLTAFPYYAFMEQRFSTSESSIIEIPVVITDVFNIIDGPMTEENNLEKADQWLDITNRYNANNACINLLIHPNRGYKLESLIHLIDNMPSSIKVLSLEEFGEFWRDRNNLDYNSYIADAVLHVDFLNPVTIDQSFVIDNIGIDSVVFTSDLGEEIHFVSDDFSDNQRLYYQMEGTDLSINSTNYKTSNSYLYPNPASESLAVVFGKELTSGILTVYSIMGERLFIKPIFKSSQTVLNLNEMNLDPGVYIIHIQSDELNTSLKFVRE